jgi:CHAD domain-containing protein
MALSPSGKWIDIGSDGKVCDAARLSLESRLMTVLQHLPLAAYHAEQDAEHVHRLRVSTRRAMAAHKLYRDYLPRKQARWTQKQLKKLRRAAGEARDLDVLAERLKRRYGDRADQVVKRIAEERAAVQPEIVRLAERFRRKGKFLRRAAKLLESIRCDDRSCPAEGGGFFGPWAAQQLAANAEQFLAAVPDEQADMAALHRFRIRAKALRYLIELVAAACGGALRDTPYRTIEELQERLGKINDHVSARDRLRGWAAETTDSELRDALCQFAEEEVAQLAVELAAWRDWWNDERVAELRRGLVDRPAGGAMGESADSAPMWTSSAGCRPP